MPPPITPLSKPPLYPAPGVDFFDTLATPKQMNMVRNHAVVADLNAEWESWAMYTKPVAHLSKRQAATLIRFLRECAQH
jgi:hypothetical protein